MTMQDRQKKILTAVLATLLVLIALVWWGVPQLVRISTENWLVEQGATAARIGEVRFNPWLGRLKVADVDVQWPEQPPLRLDEFQAEIQWRSLWRKKVRIVTVNLSNADVRLLLVGKQFMVGGQEIAFGSPAATEAADKEAPATPWQVQVDALSIEGLHVPLVLSQQQLDIRLDNLTLSDLDTGAPEQPVNMTVAGAVNGDAVHGNIAALPFAEQPHLEGDWEFEKVQLSVVAPWLGEGWESFRGQLDGDTRLELRLSNGGLVINQKGRLGLQDYVIPDVLQGKQLSWDGEMVLDINGSDTAGTLNLKGEMQAADIGLDMGGSVVSVGQLDYQGDLELPALSDVQTLAMQGDIRGNGLKVRDDSGNQQTIDKLSVSGFTLQQGWTVSIESVVAEAIQALGAHEAGTPAQLASLRIAPLNFAMDAGVELGDVVLTSLQLPLVRQAEGGWLLPYRTADRATSDAANEVADAAASPLGVKLGKLSLAGENVILLDDAGVAPPVKTRAALEALEILEVDTSNPEQWARLKLRLRQGEYGRLALDGRVRNPGAQLDMQLTGKLEQLDIPHWSPYLAKTLGYQARHGVAEADIKGTIEQGKLDFVNTFRLNNLELEVADEVKAGKLEAQISMPLNSALTMLRDKQNNIELDIPITGDVTAPDFDVSDAVRQAVGFALKKASMSYLKYALQPYGALIMLGQMVGDQAGKVRFAPVEFAPGQTGLDATAQDYLAKVAGMLDERPGLQINLCGYAAPADRATLTTEAATDKTPTTAPVDKTLVASGEQLAPEQILKDMARQRADQAKRYLVEQFSIDAGRLFTCLPQIDENVDSTPRIEMSM